MTITNGVLGGDLSYSEALRSVFGSSVISHFAHAETSGTAAVDAINAYNGTYTGASLGVSGIGDGKTAARFAGSAYCDIGGKAGLNNGMATAFANQWTVNQWVYMDEGAYGDGVLRRTFIAQADASNRVILYHDSSNQDWWYANYAAGGTSLLQSIQFFSAKYGGWSMFTLTGNKAADRFRLYINGDLIGTSTALGSFTGTPGTNFIGAGSAVPGQPFLGNIAHTTIASKELSQTEITSLFNSIGHRRVVWEGDSRTTGTGATNSAYHYPSQAVRKLTGVWSASNVGTGGNTVATMITQISAEVAPLFSATNSKNIAVLWGGVNDNTDATTMHNRISSWCSTVRALGFKVVVCTEIDAQSAAHLASGWHATNYPALNTLIRANWTSYADAIADLGANANLQDATNVTYFNADLVHLTNAGYGVVAGVVAPVVAAL